MQCDGTRHVPNRDSRPKKGVKIPGIGLKEFPIRCRITESLATVRNRFLLLVAAISVVGASVDRARDARPPPIPARQRLTRKRRRRRCSGPSRKSTSSRPTRQGRTRLQPHLPRRPAERRRLRRRLVARSPAAGARSTKPAGAVGRNDADLRKRRRPQRRTRNSTLRLQGRTDRRRSSRSPKTHDYTNVAEDFVSERPRRKPKFDEKGEAIAGNFTAPRATTATTELTAIEIDKVGAQPRGRDPARRPRTPDRLHADKSATTASARPAGSKSKTCSRPGSSSSAAAASTTRPTR